MDDGEEEDSLLMCGRGLRMEHTVGVIIAFLLCATAGKTLGFKRRLRGGPFGSIFFFQKFCYKPLFC